jgi:UDP-GlcNAc:undecaprenyl-phosphate GlcNAc-1-phosphate transferase
VGRELPFLSTTSPFLFRDAGIVLIGGAMVCGVGVLDDLFELDWLTKLGGQVLAVAFLVYSGIQFYFFPQPDGEQFSLDPAQRALLTAVLVIATINAVNFVDGLDGLAAGVIGIGAIAYFLFTYQLANLNGITLATTGALLSASLAGACLGFLPHNFHPARLFMGDSGSMLIGLVLSTSALSLTGQFTGTEISRQHSEVNPVVFFLPLLLPISILIVPLADLVLAFVRRGWAGRSPMAADKQHLHHRLLEIGHSQRRAVLIMWMWAALVSFATVLFSLYSGTWTWVCVGVMSALTIGLTFLLPVVHKPGESPPEPALESDHGQVA